MDRSNFTVTESFQHEQLNIFISRNTIQHMFRSSKTELKDKGLVTVERKKKKKANRAEGNKLAESRYKVVGCGCKEGESSFCK